MERLTNRKTLAIADKLREYLKNDTTDTKELKERYSIAAQTIQSGRPFISSETDTDLLDSPYKQAIEMRYAIIEKLIGEIDLDFDFDFSSLPSNQKFVLVSHLDSLFDRLGNTDMTQNTRKTLETSYQSPATISR